MNGCFSHAQAANDDALADDDLPAYAELHCLSDFSFLRGASSAEDLFAAVRAPGSQDACTLELDRDLVTELVCADCGTSEPVFRARQVVGMKQAACVKCGKTRRPTLIHAVDSGSPSLVWS